MYHTYNKKYIDENSKNNLIYFKYKGDELSLFYKYISNPFCEYIIQYFPKSISPNLITISGFFLNLYYVILTIYYGGWKGTNYYPPWVCYSSVIAYSLYYILDLCDGKQARRLKVSTPLGCLFDHGTDAFTSFFISIGCGSLIYFQNFYEYFIIYTALSLGFFTTTWENYYVGELILPIINGFTEGMLMTNTIFILSGKYGSSFFYKNVIGKIKLNLLISLIVLFSSVCMGIKSIVYVLKKVHKKKMFEAVKNTIIYILFISSLLSIALLNDSVIAKKYPKFLIITYGLLMVKILCSFQLSFILKTEVNTFSPVLLIPILSILIHSIIYFLTGVQFLVNVDVLICTVFIWNLTVIVHFIYFASEEICEILNVKRLGLSKRYPDKEGIYDLNKKLK